MGYREQAVKIKRGVGGKAFPNDFNWICPDCGNECRSYETTCQNCDWEAQVRGTGYELTTA
jgi:hypothetical protein